MTPYGEIRTRSVKETETAGAEFAKQLRPGDLVALFGGLGMGKTAFVRGIAAGLSITAPVSSPTFALVHEYGGPVTLYHFDMYRIDDFESLYSTGFFDYLDAGAVCAVEWSENIRDDLPPNYWSVTFSPDENENERVIKIEKHEPADGIAPVPKRDVP